MVSAYAGAALVVGVVGDYLIRKRLGRAPSSAGGYHLAVGVGAAIAVASVALSDAPAWTAAVAAGVSVCWFATLRRRRRSPPPTGASK